MKPFVIASNDLDKLYQLDQKNPFYMTLDYLGGEKITISGIEPASDYLSVRFSGDKKSGALLAEALRENRPVVFKEGTLDKYKVRRLMEIFTCQKINIRSELENKEIILDNQEIYFALSLEDNDPRLKTIKEEKAALI